MKNHAKAFSFMTFDTKLWLVQKRFRFDKVGGFIRVYGGTRYLISFAFEKYDFIYNRSR